MAEDGSVTVAFGISVADPTIPWPERGTEGKCLVARDGWEARTIPTRDRGRPTTMRAMCRGALAVNVMFEGGGFAISLASNSWRISYDGGVFAHCGAAMDAVEAMLAVDTDWDRASTEGFTDMQRACLKRVFEGAERRGEITLDRSFPC